MQLKNFSCSEIFIYVESTDSMIERTYPAGQWTWVESIGVANKNAFAMLMGLARRLQTSFSTIFDRFVIFTSRSDA
jgi:hypothetical protein